MNTREHARFLGSMFIYVIASHATMVVDAAVGGNLLGSDAVSAVELVMPVYEIFYSIVMLFGMGACTLSSLAFGRKDIEAVRRHFTAAILPLFAVTLVLGMVIALFSERIGTLLADNSDLTVLTQRYLAALVPYLVISGVQITGMLFTAMAGHPGWVMCCALTQFAVNLVCNLLLMGVAQMGIEALAYSSFISTAASLLILLPAYLKKDCPFRMKRCSKAELRETLLNNIKYGSVFVMVNIAYMIMAGAMNALVLRFMGKDALFNWSVVMMIYITGDYASSAAGETSLSLGGRYQGADDKSGAKMVYDRSLLFSVAWIGVILTAVFTLPHLFFPLFGAADKMAHAKLIPWVMLAVPFIAGTSIANLYWVRLIPQGSIWLYCTLSMLLFLSVPAMFWVFHLLLPGCEQVAFPALLFVQIAFYLIARRKCL